jgi:16S rRNA processing protein RimM
MVPLTGQAQESENRDQPQEPQTGAPGYLEIGRVVAVRGLGGEMRVDLVDPDGAQFLRADEVYLGGERLCLKVRQARLFKGQGLLKVEGVDDRDAAEHWRDATVYVTADNVASLDEGEYYYRQVLGLSVVTEEGEQLGQVTDVIATGANDVYVVRDPNDEEILLPAIKDVVLKIDLDQGTMTVRLLDGLRD